MTIPRLPRCRSETGGYGYILLPPASSQIAWQHFFFSILFWDPPHEYCTRWNKALYWKIHRSITLGGRTWGLSMGCVRKNSRVTGIIIYNGLILLNLIFVFWVCLNPRWWSNDTHLQSLQSLLIVNVLCPFWVFNSPLASWLFWSKDQVVLLFRGIRVIVSSCRAPVFHPNPKASASTTGLGLKQLMPSTESTLSLFQQLPPWFFPS